MKVALKKSIQNDGSVLAVSLMICGILGLLMGSYLLMVQTQNLSVARAQSWNSAIFVAEAGVEEAMSHLNSAGTNNLAVNSWAARVGGCIKTNSLGNDYYVSSIIVTGSLPVVVSSGYVSGPIGTPKLSRTVQIGTKAKIAAVPPGAMVVSTTVDFKGFGITTDSFVSTNANYSSNGLYFAGKALDHGDVWSISTQTNAVNVGNGKIKGSVHTAPNGQVIIGSGGSVGDMAWVNGGKQGIQGGHAKDDSNFSFPDSTLPNTGGKLWLPPVAGNYKINGVTYKYLLNSNSFWKITTLDGGVYVNGPGVKLWITGGFALGSKDEIRISSNGGKPGDLSLYVSAANANIAGNGIINDTGFAKSFSYFGLPANTVLNFGANVAFVGKIYAPEADFTLGGGGNNTYDFIGQSVTRSAKMNGHYNFHYDEALSSSSAASGYSVAMWDEL